jgi:GDPmannose 4,6-dehydratase
VQINPEYFRPTEVDLLIGDATKAKRELGWTPTVHLPEMVAEMIEADLSLL